MENIGKILRKKQSRRDEADVEEMKKEIESLKRKTFYSMIGFLVMSVIYMSSAILQSQRYATIQDYYYDSFEDYRELNQQLWEQNQVLEEILFGLRSHQPQKN